MHEKFDSSLRKHTKFEGDEDYEELIDEYVDEQETPGKGKKKEKEKKSQK